MWLSRSTRKRFAKVLPTLLLNFSQLKFSNMPERKVFKFYKSYFDVYNELDNKNKIEFIEALFNKQFYGIEPTNLKGLAKFAYISQKHNIDAQVAGYESKVAPIEPPSVPPIIPPNAQDKEEKKKEKKEEIELKEIPAFSDFEIYALIKEPKLNLKSLKLKYDSWTENNWKDGNGKDIKNWKVKLLNTIPFLKVDEVSNSKPYVNFKRT